MFTHALRWCRLALEISINGIPWGRLRMPLLDSLTWEVNLHEVPGIQRAAGTKSDLPVA